MSNGWIKLHRQLAENKLWFSEPFTKSQAWIDLVLHANHEDGSFWVRGIEVHVQRGEIAWSEVTMAERWQWSRNKVRRFVAWLEHERQVEQQIISKITSKIRIINYDKYQGDTTERQQKDNRRNTNKKNKKNKNSTELRSDESQNPMYYQPVDEDGNPLRRRNKKKDKPQQDKETISLGFEFQRQGEKATGVPPDLTKAYFIIKNAREKQGLSPQDIRDLYSYFFKDPKLTPEQRVSLAFCLSPSYITQWKVAKRHKQVSQVEASLEIKL